MLQDSSIPWFFLFLLLLFRLFYVVEGGGRLLSPPGREREDLSDFFNCGGVAKQWGSWQGRCGVCGEEWGVPSQRPGISNITSQYYSGETLDLEVELNTNLGGSFQLYLCPDPTNSTTECFAKHQLYLASTTSTTYHLLSEDKVVKLQYNLPNNFTCTHCVLQWRYTSDNLVTWNESQEANHEEFRACADIAIQTGQEVTTVVSTGVEVDETRVHEIQTVNDTSITTNVPNVDKVSTITELQTVTEQVTVAEKEAETDELTVAHSGSSVDVTSVAFSRVIETIDVTADVTTIQPRNVVIENADEATETPLITISSEEIIMEEKDVNLNKIIKESISNKAHLNLDVYNFEKATINPSVMEIVIVGSSSEDLSASLRVYTVAPEELLTPQYNLFRNDKASLSESNQEDLTVNYEITRAKPTTDSESLMLSTPARVTSVRSITVNHSLQTTDPIFELGTTAPVNLVVPYETRTTTATTATTAPVKVTRQSQVTSTFFPPKFVATENDALISEIIGIFGKVKHSVTDSTSTKATKSSTSSTTKTIIIPTSLRNKITPTQVTTITIKTETTTTTGITTLQSTTTIRSTPITSTRSTTETTLSSTIITTISSTTIRSTTSGLVGQTIHKSSSAIKSYSNTMNSISEDTSKKVFKENEMIDPEAIIASSTNHTVIIYSRGPSLGYGLFLSVPAAIIFFVGVFLVYLKKKAEDAAVQKKRLQPGDNTLYHSVPKDDSEAGEQNTTQVTNMTNTTSTSEHIHTMTPEYASIPDVVPTILRSSQRRRMDMSMDEGCHPGNSMPNLNQVINIPIEENYDEIPVAQYSSLNELNSPESSPKPSVGKRWLSEDLEKKTLDSTIEICAPHQRWKSEDWEKDQSFIALLAMRLEHVDSRAEVTEL